FNTIPNSATNRDNITDFNVAADTIRLENTGAGLFTMLANGFLSGAAFKANVTGTATDADDRIIYNTTTGALSYDSNGSIGGSANAIQFATLTSVVKPALTNSDFFIF
ncbi:MAG: calcium-binding protein, partial [Hyphomicrobium sp.]